MAQLAEHPTFNRDDVGSIPTRPKRLFCGEEDEGSKLNWQSTRLLTGKCGFDSHRAYESFFEVNVNFGA